MNIRQTKPEDFNAIEQIANQTYSDAYFESAESFQSKILGYPEGCFVAELDGVVGYIVSFPYILNEVYPINHFYKPVESPNCHYIHDLCVDKNYRKLGVAKKLLDAVFSSYFDNIALVSVMNSEGFWKKFGFITMKEFNYCGLLAHYMIHKR